jgi:hypothetical protein
MAHVKGDDDGVEPRLSRAIDWLNEKLLPYLGPPPLGPYGPETLEQVSLRPCPICGHPIQEHRVEVDEATGHCYLHHPDENFTDVLQVL